MPTSTTVNSFRVVSHAVEKKDAAGMFAGDILNAFPMRQVLWVLQ
jgi:hypothetical protein